MKLFHNGLAWFTTFFISSLFLASLALAAQPSRNDHGLNIARIEKLSGLKGKLSTNEKVFKIAVPRTFLDVEANGTQISEEMGLTSWISFKHHNKTTYMLGDLVLTPDQVNPVMGAALNNDVQITSLHNGYLWETPQIVFMHIEATGKQDDLAKAAGKLFAAIEDSSDGNGELPLATLTPDDTTLNPRKLDALLGVSGTLKDGVYKYILHKTAETDNYPISSSMGLHSWVSFIGSNKESVVNGNFLVEQEHLQKTLSMLHKADIFIVGIRDHTADSEPKFVSVHFWGVGDTKKMAAGIRDALELQQTMKD